MGFSLGNLGNALAVINPSLAIGASTTTGYADKQEARHSAKTQYKYNSWLQGQNEAFQREMAQNAHQWETEDLKKAGLNRVLSAGGSTAGAIAGSSASQGTSPGNAGTNFSNSMANLTNLITANSAKELNDKLGDKTVAETNNINENTKNITPLARSVIQQNQSQTAKNQSEINNNQVENKILTEELAQAKVDTAIAEVDKMLKTGDFGKAKAYIDATIDSLQGVAGVVGSAVLGPLMAFKGVKTAKEAQNLINTHKANRASHSTRSHHSYR